jgi:hypothetical protein
MGATLTGVFLTSDHPATTAQFHADVARAEGDGRRRVIARTDRKQREIPGTSRAGP